MSYWIELHCDAVKPDGKLACTDASTCRSFQGDNVGLRAWSTDRMMARLHQSAREAGWHAVRGGWVCDWCWREGRRRTEVQP